MSTDHLIISKREIHGFPPCASSIRPPVAALPRAATTPHSPTERLAIFTADRRTGQIEAAVSFLGWLQQPMIKNYRLMLSCVHLVKLSVVLSQSLLMNRTLSMGHGGCLQCLKWVSSPPVTLYSHPKDSPRMAYIHHDMTLAMSNSSIKCCSLCKYNYICIHINKYVYIVKY